MSFERPGDTAHPVLAHYRALGVASRGLVAAPRR